MNDYEPPKFRDRYRIESTRLKNYDYSQNGAYFITICTKDRQHFFGKIIDDQMKLSDMGQIANNCWQQISDHFPFVVLDQSVVMPNHIHGIIFISKNNVETLHATSLPQQRKTQYHGSNHKLSVVSPHKYSLSSIIRSYKSAVTKKSREQNPLLGAIWQPRFHDRIIRDASELNTIRQYIISNPHNWPDDKNFSDSKIVISQPKYL